jgi:hypothetical protein
MKVAEMKRKEHQNMLSDDSWLRTVWGFGGRKWENPSTADTKLLDTDHQLATRICT